MQRLIERLLNYFKSNRVQLILIAQLFFSLSMMCYRCNGLKDGYE